MGDDVPYSETSSASGPTLLGSCAVVTGAAKGIGRACALALGRAGCNVAVLDLSDKLDAAGETATAIRSLGPEAQSFELDVRKVDSFDGAVNDIEERLGPIRVWVNNAGVIVRKPAIDVSPAEWDQVIDVCLRGVFFASQAAARAMRRHDGGSIVSISSVFGLVAGINRVAYSVSKAGIVHMTRVLAAEWSQYGIRVNCVAPCFVDTPMTRELLRTGLDVQNKTFGEKLADPDDVARAVAFLANSVESRMITGHTLTVDGGWTTW
jgi:2-dehydro-3-deoxy-D-gluconate 5-dehydrogenase